MMPSKNRNETNKIHKEHLILCEGIDEKNFLINYLNSPSLSNTPAFSKNIQVEDFGGNEDLPSYLSVLKLSPGFSDVKSLLIVRDAERSPQSAVQQIQNSLEKYHFPVPSVPHEWTDGSPKVGFLLFPTCCGNVTTGTLEDLCLSILEESESSIVLGEIDNFLSHLKTEGLRGSFPHEFKTKLHTYFSITDKYVSLKIGEAARAGAFDWNSTKLDPLKNFLLEVI